ncbi:hypothetical protein EPA93_33645 [Ktedonosporobacter rubrisoli]|uniref:Uncharacterized protein n=1 Tax=Ktedonosporobacter rubrisoli TaxID=2509675 RepID=A0A4P6JYS3_KTERU|nr:hypothetical protein [Ktedonosporobacter rubrisoli]QBD80652.1 hypothetical protein EPA93_33645 [Ktedonosporobacter rubrisoli]
MPDLLEIGRRGQGESKELNTPAPLTLLEKLAVKEIEMNGASRLLLRYSAGKTDSGFLRLREAGQAIHM